MVFAFCAAMAISPAAVAVVGDAPHDLIMGRTAGAGLTIGVLGGTSAREDLTPYADRLIAGIPELLSLAELKGA
jgi:phosphoglycolate phosphatase